MPKKNSGDTAKRLGGLVAEIQAAAYERGRADARKELRDALAPDRARLSRTGGAPGKGARKRASAKRSSGGRKRAPRGTVPPFVERVLRAHPGSTAREILARAANDGERSVLLTSIQTHLHVGRTRGRYVAIDGRWSLAGADAVDATGKEAPATDESLPSEPVESERGPHSD